MQALQQAELQIAELSAALQGAEARLQQLSAEKAALAAAAAAAPAASQQVRSLELACCLVWHGHVMG